MKRILFACFNFLIVCVFSQEKTHTSNIEVSNFYGNIAEHSISISHLITSHPYGSIVSGINKHMAMRIGNSIMVTLSMEVHSSFRICVMAF